MFGRNSAFRSDPFFSTDIMAEFDRMDRMMSDFTGGFSGFGGFGMPSIMGPGGLPSGRRHNRELMPFGGFGRSMFDDMNMMMSQARNNPDSQSYSSTRVMSYSNTGSGAPNYYEATSETTQGPNGVRQTKRSERSSETGINKMAIGHHIYDRGHVVERSMNRRTNEREENHDFINLDEAEKESFHREWQGKARSIGADRVSHHRREPRALTSSEYHRQNLDRARARHHSNEQPTSYRRNNDMLGDRHVRINSRADEI